MRSRMFAAILCCLGAGFFRASAQSPGAQPAPPPADDPVKTLVERLDHAAQTTLGAIGTLTGATITK